MKAATILTDGRKTKEPQNGICLIAETVGGSFFGESTESKTNLLKTPQRALRSGRRGAFWVVVPKRLRELLLRQLTKVRNQAESALHEGLRHTQSRKIGSVMRVVPVEGML